MKLVRYGKRGSEKPGLQTEEGVFDISGFVQDIGPELLSAERLNALRQWWSENQSQCEKVKDGVRLGIPVQGISKIICIGLNYADHARETKATPPEEPIVFFKAPSSLSGPNDPVVIPKNSTKTDWEVELAVVIGKSAAYVDEADAMDHVAGYCLHNDYSERAFQLERGGQWVKGKSADTFAPLGPWLVTPEEITDVNQLRLWLTVNGESMQDGNTSDLIFKIPYLISYVSQFMRLLPGDVISTGTPAGVAMGMDPQRYLQPGDVVELGIDGLGTSRQVLEAWAG